jgi:small subunit ribosomal protein S8
MTDPISDMLSRIRNAVGSKHTRVDIPASRLKAEIARILEDEGYIHGFKLVEEKPEKTRADKAEKADKAAKAPVPRQVIRISLKYGPHGERVITGIERISRPGRRVYFRSREVPHVLGGLGTNILTTSRGVMTGRAAMRAGVGGEVLCNVW